MTTKDLEQQARNLIARWRKEATTNTDYRDDVENGCSMQLEECADELEALLEKHDE